MRHTARSAADVRAGADGERGGARETARTSPRAGGRVNGREGIVLPSGREAVLLATIGAGESTDGFLKLGDALRVISALRAVGLEQDARLLAIETAVASGL